MPELSSLSDTLYVPLLGRIYASKYHPDILYDGAALSLWDQLPQRVREMPGQTEYTQLASAVRSKNIDLSVRSFLDHYPNGAIVNVGCGLESLYERNDNGQAQWFELDLPEVLALRKEYFPPRERDHYLPCSMFEYAWIEQVRAQTQGPVLVIASGLFVYFKKERVIHFIEQLSRFGQAQLVFDVVSSAGINISRRYMKKMDRQDAEMFFSVDKPEDFAKQINAGIVRIESRKFYAIIKQKNELALSTKLKMSFSDLFNMVKLIEFTIDGTSL